MISRSVFHIRKFLIVGVSVRNLIVICLLFIGALAASEAFAFQTPPDPYHSNGVNPINAFISFKWKDKSDPALVKARREIEKAFADPKADAKKLWATADAAARSPRRNGVTLYRWALTAYYAGVHGHLVNLTRIGEELRAAPDDDYEWVRVRYLTEPGVEDHRPLLRLGKRLLARDPNDDEVGYVTVRYAQYHSFKVRANFIYALDLAMHLHEKHANEARSSLAVGSVYEDAWFALHDKQFAAKALRYYEAYLRLKPKAKGPRWDAILKELREAAGTRR